MFLAPFQAIFENFCACCVYDHKFIEILSLAHGLSKNQFEASYAGLKVIFMYFKRQFLF